MHYFWPKNIKQIHHSQFLSVFWSTLKYLSKCQITFLRHAHLFDSSHFFRSSRSPPLEMSDYGYLWLAFLGFFPPLLCLPHWASLPSVRHGSRRCLEPIIARIDHPAASASQDQTFSGLFWMSWFNDRFASCGAARLACWGAAIDDFFSSDCLQLESSVTLDLVLGMIYVAVNVENGILLLHDHPQWKYWEGEDEDHPERFLLNGPWNILVWCLYGFNACCSN